jgi:hypothetical protein
LDLLRDATFNTIAMADVPSRWQVGPRNGEQGAYVVRCIVAANGELQQTTVCPVKCISGTGDDYSWSCNGLWYSRDIGGCSKVQPYVVPT